MRLDSNMSNAIRALSMDAVEKANSGHPGMPMGMADIAYVLWRKHLKHNPANPQWANRDRFVLSNGHGSMLLYSLLYLCGYPLTIDDLKQFRQLHSKTPGHPEWHDTPGVETTTGPLGQGLANAVGMALAEQLLAAQYNRDNFDIIDHFTYVFVGDGCLMEGISHEVCSLAGTLKLGKLIAIWDDNGISIDGEVINWFADDTPSRFEAYGWQVIREVDGHDLGQIDQAIQKARDQLDQPTLICCKTTIGFGAPTKAGTAASHGAPLGSEEVQQAKAALNWPHLPFDIPTEIKTAWDMTQEGEAYEANWAALFSAYQDAHPTLARELSARLSGELPKDWSSFCASFIDKLSENSPSVATRKASLNVLNEIAPELPALIGGSADLTGSNCTKWQGATMITPHDVTGNYIEYGVREFGMFAIMNGLSLHGGFIPFGGTFLVFSDYARNALRMAALMKLRTIFVFTHDSIGLGEDGPTHQPVEHLASLRLIPNLHVWRPCDTAETSVAWIEAVSRKNGPTALSLSRQTLKAQPRNNLMRDSIQKGGYVLAAHQDAKITLCATGSEVGLAMEAKQQLEKEGIFSRVVSMPCIEAFETQDPANQKNVLAPHLPIIFIEAGSGDMWYKLAVNHHNVKVVSIDSFGLSGPAEAVFEAFNVTTEHITTLAQAMVLKTNNTVDTAD